MTKRVNESYLIDGDREHNFRIDKLVRLVCVSDRLCELDVML